MVKNISLTSTEEKKPLRCRIAKKALLLTGVFFLAAVFLPMRASAAAVDVNINGNGANTLEIIEMLTLLALLPSILIMTTCFTRIVIVLSFLRNALGLQQTPPNQVVIGISLFLTLFIMSPVVTKINTDAYQPYKEEKITQEEFLQKASVPLKEFMLKNTKKEDLNLFVNLAKQDSKTPAEQMPITLVIPAFMTSELKRAFIIGFLLYIPFMIIDMIVSSTLMSMGMIMLPPATISLPFKLLLFVLVDGWDLLFKTLASGFHL
ncbi:flagellar biosynthesis protein FliP [Caproiciproducens sp. NJN-50]|nr:flagellar biosynthesis protein FliP [Caproiciproducens sp. NJN-50]